MPNAKKIKKEQMKLNLNCKYSPSLINMFASLNSDEFFHVYTHTLNKCM